MKNLLTEEEVAVLLRCKPKQVRRLGIAGRYLQPARKRQKRYFADAVEAFATGADRQQTRKTADVRKKDSEATRNAFWQALIEHPAPPRKRRR